MLSEIFKQNAEHIILGFFLYFQNSKDKHLSAII